MTQLNFDRIEFEVTNRLRGTFRNPVAESLLKERCVSAVKLGTLNQTELFSGIIVTKPNLTIHVVKSEQVVHALKSTGVLDLVSICINAQKEEN